MRPPNSIEDKIAYGIGGLIALVVLYYSWVYVVGFLALCGAYFLIQEYQKSQNDRNRRR